jgi:hypothetical protein
MGVDFLRLRLRNLVVVEFRVNWGFGLGHDGNELRSSL